MAARTRAGRRRGRGPGSALASEPLPLHVRPDLLRHHGRPDRRAAEHLLDRVLAPLEADRVAAERLLLRHVPSSSCGWGRARPPDSRGYYYHIYEGRERENTIRWGGSERREIYP